MHSPLTWRYINDERTKQEYFQKKIYNSARGISGYEENKISLLYEKQDLLY